MCERERLQIMVEDARRCGVEIIFDHPVAQWAVSHFEWIQNFLVKSNVDLGNGGTMKVTPHEARTGDKAPSNVVGFLEPGLVRSRINDDKQPRFVVGRGLGHTDAVIVTLMEDGSVCVTTVRGNTVPKGAVMQKSMNFRARSQR